ncbi:MAG: nicotinate-nucleotide--dimethylbenzimidazole phosphoribosyltransferase [Coriobacteriia bacterium]
MNPTEWEMAVLEAVRAVEAVDGDFERLAWERLDSLTKPPRSLGRLEELAARVAVIQRDVRPDVSTKAVVLMAGDHGVVAQGVAAYPQSVTAQMVANFATGGAAISQLASHAGARLVLVDVGVAADVSNVPGVRDVKIAWGTKDMTEGPAMTREEASRAFMAGVDIARELAAEGVRLIATGEMGIGNTTAAAAVTSALTGARPEDVVGPGTGLGADGVARKTDAVRRALAVNAPDASDPLGVVASVGGLEIAGLAGVIVGGAAAGVCVISDGFISGAATLVAVRMCPACAGYVLPSHRSAEPGHRVVLEALGLEPVFDLDMRLGEGSGAALAMSIVEAACRVMSGMATFGEAGVSTRED